MTRSTLVLVTALLASCAVTGSQDGDATTAASTSTTTPAASTSTVALPTTTVATTTTTEGILPLAYVDWGGMALGWWDGSGWVQADETSTLPVQGGESYQVALLGSDAVIEGGPPENVACEVNYPEGFPGVPFEDQDALRTILDDGSPEPRSVSGLAVAAPWDITPRPVTEGQASPEMEAVALGLLAERGFTRDSAPIVQVVEGDLDGDGSVESVVVTEDTEDAPDASDVYSIVFVTSSSSSNPVVVAESVYPQGEPGYPASLRASALADTNGDGAMEVVVEGDEWESGWIAVFERTAVGYQSVLAVGCGP